MSLKEIEVQIEDERRRTLAYLKEILLFLEVEERRTFEGVNRDLDLMSLRNHLFTAHRALSSAILYYKLRDVENFNPLA